MEKMIIKINEELAEQKDYDLEKMWAFIDKAFDYGKCFKKNLEDGSVEYSGNPEYDNYLCNFGIARNKLKAQSWFMECATKWLWYSNDSDESAPMHEMNVLERLKSINR